MTESPLIVLANRAPLSHKEDGAGGYTIGRTASGLVTAVEPLVASAQGAWIAHGEPADLAATSPARDLRVSTAEGSYLLQYVPCPTREYAGFYNGFANEGLWPLCHDTPVAPVFRRADFIHYRSANRRFARAVAESSTGLSPIVLVQDYHFALAPAFIRRHRPAAAISTFWHIPWPSAHVFRTCPWAGELLTGLMQSDVIALQTDRDCRHLLDAVVMLTDASVDLARGLIHHRGHVIRVAANPVGVSRENPALDGLPATTECRRSVLAAHGLAPDTHLIVGVDRMDYSKGIPEKFLALERLLERRADLRGRITLLQVAEPSRATLPAYRAARTAAAEVCDRLRVRFGNGSQPPVLLLERHHDASEVYRLYRAADVCWVNSLDDGMNLVAKEFVAARDDNRGVLLLSERAGASQQLTDALPVHPSAIERTARTLERAIQMPIGEQAWRMRRMRQVVLSADSERWARTLLDDVVRAVAERPEAPPATAWSSTVPVEAS
ncbi:MAG: trehalose-6-phosphate synthase [Vicinamibacterales bacterium]